MASRLGLTALAGAADRGHEPDVPASSWNTVSSVPQALYGAAGVSNGTYAYAAGGYAGGTTLDTFYRYNPVNERWETLLPAMPGAAGRASAVYYPTGNKIYVFGGEDPTGAYSNATRIFDVTTSTWSSGANMPGPRASMAAGYNSADGRIYLVGGYTSDDPSSAQTTTWEYNPATNAFITTRAPIPHPVGGCRIGCHRRPSLRGRRAECGGCDRSRLGLQRRREHLDGQGRHAGPDERRW